MAPIFTGIARTLGGYGFGRISSASGGATVNLDSGISATGGVIHQYEEDGQSWKVHTFTDSGYFNVSALGTSDNNHEIEYLLVGGGAGGGNQAGGGGGAGGLRTNVPNVVDGAGTSISESPMPITPYGTGNYNVTVGKGGYMGRNESPGKAGTDGYNTQFFFSSSGNPSNRHVYGGGYGGGYNPGSAGDGGCGGGSGGPGAYGPALGSPSSSYGTKGNEGFPGGYCTSGHWGAGGGGAGGAGAYNTSPSGPAGTGGLGVKVPILPGPAPEMGMGGRRGSTTDQWWAGGGGGCGSGSLPQHPTTGPGGGAPGNSAGPPAQWVYPNTNAWSGGGNGGNDQAWGVRGASYTGGGGGGGRDFPGASQAGYNIQGARQGAQGVCIIRYKIDTPAKTAKASGGHISFTPGGKTMHVFLSPGKWTNTSGGDIPACNILAVGGGGAGGGCDPTRGWGGGGGAGGVVNIMDGAPAAHKTLPGSVTEYDVKVGRGGDNSYTGYGCDIVAGSDTVFGAPGNPHYIKALGGGAGGTHGGPQSQGGPGGSGGGSGHSAGSGAAQQPQQGGLSGSYGNGHNGGGPYGGPGGGGGGGGAGGSGGDAGPGGNCNGGNGIQVPTTFLPSTDYPSFLGYIGPNPGFRYFGAGGGGSQHTPNNTGLGGLGGGGQGAQQDGYAGFDAGCGGPWPNPGPAPAGSPYAGSVFGRGSGGGGAAPGGWFRGGMGSDGVLIITYPS